MLAFCIVLFLVTALVMLWIAESKPYKIERPYKSQPFRGHWLDD